MTSDPNPILGSRFVDAVAFAIELHSRQARKGTAIPYLTHLLAVSSLVLEDGGNEDQAIAGLLHDGPEDQGGEPILEEIRRQFGDVVAGIVDGLTDAMPGPGEDKEKWRPRKERYLERLDTESESVLRVSLADKLHNLRSIETDLADPRVGDAVWQRFNVDSDQAWYFKSLLPIFGRRMPESRNLPAFRKLVEKVFSAEKTAAQDWV